MKGSYTCHVETANDFVGQAKATASMDALLYLEGSGSGNGSRQL